MSSQGVSSGPSANDPGLGGFMAGGTDYSAFSPVPDASSGSNASVGASTVSQALTAPQLPPMIGTGGTFSADTTAISGVGQPQQSQDSFSSLGSSTVGFGSPPVDAFGSTGPSATPSVASVPSFGGAAAPSSGPVGGGPGPGAGTGGIIPSGGGNSIEDLLSQLGQGALKSITSNPLGILAGAAPLIKQAISPAKIPQQAQLQGLAAQEQVLQAQQQQYGTALTSPLITGQLPSGAKQQVDNAVNDAISTTKARYANLGLSGSTMEADAVSNIQNQSSALTFQIAENMAQTGQAALSGAASALGLQDQVYSQLMQAQVAQDNALQQAIANFASAASGAPKNLSVKLGS